MASALKLEGTSLLRCCTVFISQELPTFWRIVVHAEHWQLLTSQHGITSPKTFIISNIVVKTSNLHEPFFEVVHVLEMYKCWQTTGWYWIIFISWSSFLWCPHISADIIVPSQTVCYSSPHLHHLAFWFHHGISFAFPSMASFLQYFPLKYCSVCWVNSVKYDFRSYVISVPYNFIFHESKYLIKANMYVNLYCL
jgi:hypothetical protein